MREGGRDRLTEGREETGRQAVRKAGRQNRKAERQRGKEATELGRDRGRVVH